MLKQIQQIRAKNNKVWMQFPKVLAEIDPEKFEKIMKQIIDLDKKINDLSKKLI